MTKNPDPPRPTAQPPPANGEEQEVPILVEVRGDFRPIYRLAEQNVLGRSPECTIWVMDPLVSRRHAEINRTPTGQFELTDLDSAFGTFVNRQKVSSRLLAVGDVIFLGATQLGFEMRNLKATALRRHQTRLRCELPVRVLWAGQRVDTIGTDLSLGGLRVDWTQPLELGTEVEIRIDLPDSDTPLRQKGRASHWSDDTGLGIRFRFASEEEEQRVAEAYIRLYLRASPYED